MQSFKEYPRIEGFTSTFILATSKPVSVKL